MKQARIVIDASVSLSWSLADEANERADQALTVVENVGALVPTLWTYEIANSLAHFVRRARIDADRARLIQAALTRLPIVTIPPDSPDWCLETSALAAKHDLTIYDASYLHIALTSRSKLASLDKKLHAAAVSEGIAFDGTLGTV